MNEKLEELVESSTEEEEDKEETKAEPAIYITKTCQTISNCRH